MPPLPNTQSDLKLQMQKSSFSKENNGASMVPRPSEQGKHKHGESHKVLAGPILIPDPQSFLLQ